MGGRGRDAGQASDSTLTAQRDQLRVLTAQSEAGPRCTSSAAGGRHRRVSQSYVVRRTGTGWGACVCGEGEGELREEDEDDGEDGVSEGGSREQIPANATTADAARVDKAAPGWRRQLCPEHTARTSYRLELIRELADELARPGCVLPGNESKKERATIRDEYALGNQETSRIGSAASITISRGRRRSERARGSE